MKENKIDPDPKKILGMTNEEILNIFYENILYKKIIWMAIQRKPIFF